MNRKEFLKKSLFGSLTLAGGSAVTEIIADQNLKVDEGAYLAPKSRKAGALALAFGNVIGSRDFPLRDGELNPRDVIATEFQFHSGSIKTLLRPQIHPTQPTGLRGESSGLPSLQ